MRVAYINQNVLNNKKSEAIKSSALTFSTKELKSDSVNFTGKANYAQNMLNLVEHSKKVVFDNFNMSKKSELMSIHLDDQVKYFFKKYNVFTYLGLGPEKTKYQLKELNGKKSKTYKLNQDEFEDLMVKVRDLAVPKVLKSIASTNLTETKSVPFASIKDLLTYIGLGIPNGNVKPNGSSAFQSAFDPLLVKEFKLLNYNNLKVELQNTESFSKFGVQIGENRVALNEQEIDKFKQVLAVKEALNARDRLNMQAMVHKIEAERMNNALAEFNKTKPQKMNILNEQLSSALSDLLKD